MKKFFQFIFCLFLIFFSFLSSKAQNTISINGIAVDNHFEMPIEAATAYLSFKKDSTVIDYTLTNEEGEFNLNVRTIEEPVFLTITDEYLGEYVQEFKNLLENQLLGIVQLQETINLEGVLIVSAPPIRIKTDTLEFNAASFKVRPDANVEALLKELPGVEIDDEGKVLVNGKEVNQILVNGKPFFDNDGSIALENLPAEIINKVQVTDTKTKKEELSGARASSNNATINLTIDEDKNKGIILKAMAGYGTNNRYESSFMLNQFKGNSRLSILGSSNNINSIGFSMNEIFDNMGSSRSRSSGPRLGSGRGITQSYLGGFSYSNDFGKNIELNTNYFYTQNDTKNNHHSRQENLLPQNIYTTESRSKTRNESFNHNFTTSIELKLDESSKIWFEPKYTFNKSNSTDVFQGFTLNELGELTNENDGDRISESLNQSFGNSVEYFKSFENKTELSFGFSNNSVRNKSDETNFSNTFFYQTEDADDIRNQFSRRKVNRDNFNFDLSYGMQLTDSLKLDVGAKYGISKNENLKNTWDFDEDSEMYINKNEFLSSEISSDIRNTNPYLSLRLQKSKIFFRLNIGVDFITQKNFGNYLSEDYDLTLDKASPSIAMNANYRFGKNATIFMNYSMNERFASAEQLLPIENISNPLNTTIGNPDLKSTKTHQLYFGLNNYIMQSRLGYGINMGGTYDERNVSSYRITDENFKTYTTYINITGNYRLFGGFNINKSFQNGQSKFRTSLSMRLNYNDQQGFINGEKYTSQTYNLSPRFNFNWDLGEILTINPSYNIIFQTTNYENFRIDKSEQVTHRFNVSTTNYWPKNFVFGNDFNYTYNSEISDGFRKDFFLWNMSLGYNFWENKMNLKVKVYDVLGQNSGSSRTISDTFISDVQNDVLERYVMFSIGYSLDQFGGKKSTRNRSGRGGRYVSFD